MRNVIILVLWCCISAITQAQNAGYKDITTSKTPIYISSTTGLGYGRHLDMGVSPLSYQGLMGKQSFCFSIDVKRVRLKAEAEGFICLSQAITQGYYPNGEEIYYEQYKSTNGGGTMKVTCLVRIKDLNYNKMHFFVGGSSSLCIDLRHTPDFGNAALGYSICQSLNFEFLYEYNFTFLFRSNKGHRTRWPFKAIAGVTTPIVSGFVRPDYAYIANAIGSEITLDYFTTVFSGFNTTLGLAYNLKNGNRIQLHHESVFNTTRNSGYHRFVSYRSSISLSIFFKIN